MTKKTEKKKSKKTNEKLELSKIIEKLFKLLGIDTSFEIREDKKQEALMVDIQADDGAGLIIGNRGRNLNSIQTITGIMLWNITGDWKRVILDVGNWREKEETRLKELASKTAERVKETGESQPIYNLSPAQRRIIHLSLSEEGDVKTESVGEGDERYVVVALK